MYAFWNIPDYPPPEPDCFVIPSYAVKNQNLPTLPTCAQIKLAYEWWLKFPSAALIMCTGDNQFLGVTNASVMSAYAQELGIPASQIIEEDRSWNTYTNLKYALEIITQRSFRSPTLVTHDLYTRCAVATAQKIGWPHFFWLSAYSKGQPAYGYKWLQTYSRTTIFCYEFGAMILSKIRGWA